MNPRHTHRCGSGDGFTLIELLVVIAIIAVLAALIFAAIGGVKVAAAKTEGISEMRNIGIAVSTWMADNGKMEPFYYYDGTADAPHEPAKTGTWPNEMQFGNPAAALFNPDSPEKGYVQNHAIFFSPLVDIEVPELSGYRPNEVLTPGNYWGTYAWYHPFVTPGNRSDRQKLFLGTFNNPGLVNPNIAGKLLMSENYPNGATKYGKAIHHALMIDGSVQYVGDSDAEFLQWKTKQP